MLRVIQVLSLALLPCVLTLELLPSNATVLTSAYAKVAKWGSIDNKNENEGRSSGQSLYTQRSEAKIRSGQNIKPKEINYHYSMKTNSRVGVDKNERLPARGEVIFQDRFNPPPYFDIVNDHKHNHNQKPSIVYGTSANEFPQSSQEVDAKPSPDSYNLPNPIASSEMTDAKKEKPSMGAYDSPISSYNQVASGIPKDNKFEISGPSYPPNNPATYTGDNGPGYNYNPPKQQTVPKFPGYVYDPPILEKPMTKFPGPYAPAEENDSKFQPSANGDQGPPITQTVPPPQDNSFYDSTYFDHHQHDHHHDYHEHDHHEHDHHEHNHHEHDHHEHDHHQHAPEGTKNSEEVDLSPPPAQPSGSENDFPKQIPEYLDHDPGLKFPYFNPYSFDDHHHHVYHEVKTTTTTEAPEDERVNKGHYSYYYLGRKLWYIPLYFSVYFIIYIAVLILKSIARHKVTFAHDLRDTVKGRSLNEENINKITNEIDKSINNFRNKYIAM